MYFLVSYLLWTLGWNDPLLSMKLFIVKKERDRVYNVRAIKLRGSLRADEMEELKLVANGN